MSIHSSLLVLGLLGAVLVPTVGAAQEPERSVTYYETLSPYGDWVVVESYGRVWRPHRHLVGVDFIPYASGGRWVYTSMGWVFEASWEWAWLPFHYGRWYEDDLNGWVWVPGDVWAPAWVEWRFGGGYIGWVPTSPRNHPAARWFFVDSEHFAEPEIWHHRAAAVSERTVLQVTHAIPPAPGIAWSQGPAIALVRATSRVEVPERRLEAPRGVLPHAVETFPEQLPPAAPRPGAPLKASAKRIETRPVPPQPLSAPAGPEVPKPQPERPAVPPQAMPAAPPPVPEQRQRAERVNPIREPSQPAQEPFRPMVESTPPARKPMPAPPPPMQRPPPPMPAPPLPMQRPPPRVQEQRSIPVLPPGEPVPVAPVKRPTLLPLGQPGPGPEGGPPPGRSKRH